MTRLSKAEGFSGLWKELVIRSNYIFYQTTLEKLKKADKVLLKRLQKEYGQFFNGVAKAFVGRYGGDRGHQLREEGWAAWPRLSDSWLDKKDEFGVSEDFYSGLSGHARYVADGGKGVKTIAATENFESFLRSMREVDVIDAFGAVVVEYSFRTKGKKFVTRDLQSITDLTQKVTQTQKDEFPEQLMITAEVQGFQNLRGTPMKEWDIVDKIVQEMGSKEQWRKINGTVWGRNGRPVRAIIGPRITWYMNSVALPALKKFNETLK